MNKNAKHTLNQYTPYPHPGSWQIFCKRPDNRQLTTEEQRRKYVKEESLFHKFNTNSWLGGGAAGGSFTGQASDGPLSGATVTSNLGSTTTNATGQFTFSDTPTGEIIVTGGVDSVTGVAYTGTLVGFAEYKTVSPLTTLAYHLKEEDNSLTADSAVDLLFASSSTLFGVELSTSDKDVMLNRDYIESSLLEDNSAALAAQSIATYLESVTEFVGNAIKETHTAEFTDSSAKIEAYRSFARQIGNMSGAKTPISHQDLFATVKFSDGRRMSPSDVNGMTRVNVETQAINVQNELAALAQTSGFSSNFITTRIQSINRAAKRDIRTQIGNSARGERTNFENLATLVTNNSGSIAQLEVGKSNEVDFYTSQRNNINWVTLGAMTFTQNGRTLSDGYVTGDVEVIDSIAVGKYLNINKGAIRFGASTNYSRTGGSIVGQTTTPVDGKLQQITLSAPGHKIISHQLIEPPTDRYLPTGRYQLQIFSGGRWNDLATPPDIRVDRNQTSVQADSADRISHTIAFNSRASRYEYYNDSSGTEELKYFITNFLSEATWDTPPDQIGRDFRIIIHT